MNQLVALPKRIDVQMSSGFHGFHADFPPETTLSGSVLESLDTDAAAVPSGAQRPKSTVCHTSNPSCDQPLPPCHTRLLASGAAS